MVYNLNCVKISEILDCFKHSAQTIYRNGYKQTILKYHTYTYHKCLPAHLLDKTGPLCILETSCVRNLT